MEATSGGGDRKRNYDHAIVASVFAGVGLLLFGVYRVLSIPDAKDDPIAAAKRAGEAEKAARAAMADDIEERERRSEAAYQAKRAADAAFVIPKRQLDVRKVLGHTRKEVDAELGKFSVEDDDGVLYEDFDHAMVDVFFSRAGRAAVVMFKPVDFAAAQRPAIVAWAHGENATITSTLGLENDVEFWAADERAALDKREADMDRLNEQLRAVAANPMRIPRVNVTGINVVHLSASDPDKDCGVDDIAMVARVAKQNHIALADDGFVAIECVSTNDKPPRVKL